MTYGAHRKTDRGEVHSPWLDADEAAAYCGRGCAEWARKRFRDGEIAAVKRGRQWLVHIAQLDATQAEVADLVGVGTRAVRAWVDFSEHGRAPSETVVRLLKMSEEVGRE